MRNHQGFHAKTDQKAPDMRVSMTQLRGAPPRRIAAGRSVVTATQPPPSVRLSHGRGSHGIADLPRPVVLYAARFTLLVLTRTLRPTPLPGLLTTPAGFHDFNSAK